MREFGLDDAELKIHIGQCIKIMSEARKHRPPPHLDNKILTAWNGLMISGCCSAGTALGKHEYIELAVNAATFLQKNMWNEERKTLYRSAYTGEDGNIHQLDPPIDGFVDDYAYLIRGLMDLYEATFDDSWLEWAAQLQDQQNELFWDTHTMAVILSPNFKLPHLCHFDAAQFCLERDFKNDVFLVNDHD